MRQRALRHDLPGAFRTGFERRWAADLRTRADDIRPYIARFEVGFILRIGLPGEYE